MRICDRCFRQRGGNVAAGVSMVLGPENYDLCVSCADVIRDLMNKKNIDNKQDAVKDKDEIVESTTRKRGRPRKTA